jgi:RNA-directed DNA polymerase
VSILIDLFVSEIGMSPNDLVQIIRSAPRRYKVYSIPKRTGGEREIAQPARELKQLQYILIDKFLSKLPVHDAAKAYRSGLSILDNAAPHAGKGPLLKLDFKDFFPSIRSGDWIKYCADNELFDETDRTISSLILFRRAKGEQLLKLSVGAPSSPSLSNALMYGFDCIVAQEAGRRRITYTRYADDLTFSGQRAGMLKDMVKVVANALRSLDYPKITLNDNKTAFVTAAVRRSVTGVVLANDGSVGLGRDRRRSISARVHHALYNEISVADIKSLAGELAFVNVVEPSFLVRLKEKYGPDVVARIKRGIVTVAPR